MQKRQKPVPFTVTSWMERDVTIRKVTANSRMITNDTRQNIVLSRKFFSDLYNLSVERYRKINEHDHDQRAFIQTQYKKCEKSLPGLRPHIDQARIGLKSARPFDKQAARLEKSDLFSGSAQSILAPPESKSDPSFDKISKSGTFSKVDSLQRTRSDLISVERAPVNVTPRPFTRDRINRLAKPKGFQEKSSFPHVRPNVNVTINPDEILTESTMETSEEPSVTALTRTSVTAADDRRFRSLFGVFTEVHERPPSRFETIQQIIDANASLQSTETGNKSRAHQSFTTQLQSYQRRQFLMNQLQTNFDNFVLGVAA